MATTVPEPPKIERRLSDSGNGGWRNIIPANGSPRVVMEYSPPPSSTAIWVVVFGISMMFAAFTSAMIVRKASLDWESFKLPSILYLNTLILFASSITLEVGRRRIAAQMNGTSEKVENPARWLHVTLLLGLVFVGGQYIAWLRLRSEGLYLATNPSSSFFYLFTVTHALHVLGGLGGLVYVLRKLSKSILVRTQLDSAARYWHFMDVLWVYLLLLLWMKL